MSYALDVRFKLTESEAEQWATDVDRIKSAIGQMPYKTLVLMAVHVFAQTIDRLKKERCK